MKQEYPTQLRYERERRGWSRNYIAEEIGVDIGTVGRWERGERVPHAHYRQKLCELFEMDAQELGLFSGILENASVEQPAANDAQQPHLLPETFKQSDDNTVLVDPYSSSLPLETTVVTTSSFTAPSQKHIAGHATYEPAIRRRNILVKVGFWGLILLMGGVSSTTSLLSSTTQRQLPLPRRLPLPQSKRLYLFHDSNTTNWVNNLAWSPDGQILASAESLIAVWDVQKEILVRYYPIMNAWANDISWSRDNMLAAANGDYQSGSLEIWKFPETTLYFSLQRSYALRTTAWSPDGLSLAFAGHNATVEIWNPTTRQKLREYTDAESGILGINRVKWSPNGRFLACATDEGTVHVWEAATGQQKIIYRGHRLRVVDLAWSPQGDFIASASIDKTAHVWGAFSGRTSIIYTRHTDEVHGISWSPDGKYIVSGSTDMTAQVWDAHMGTPVATLGEHRNVVATVLWSIDGKTIAMGNQYQGIEIWQSPV